MARNSQRERTIMKMKITLSQKSSLKTAISDEVILPMPEEQSYSVTYNMTEGCTTTDKFISLYKENIGTEFICNYNIYKQNDLDTFIKQKVEMNSIIKRINTEIDELANINISLMVDPTSLDIETAKTNALHLYFEDESNKIIESGVNYDPGIYKLLEDINQLVHSIERGVRDWTDFFCTLRVLEYSNLTSVPTMPITDEDYENFNIHEPWGSLTLDFFRVGKDLNHCYHTNDLELVKTKGLAQQNTIHTCFEMVFNDWRTRQEMIEYEQWYRKWIDDNNLKEYYDTTLPMFNLGRIVLGKIDMTGTSEEEVQNELDKCTAITNVELI